MTRLVLLLSLLSLTACGVQGDLYRPSEPKPNPKQRERNTKTYPFPERPPEEQEVMPDMY